MSHPIPTKYYGIEVKEFTGILISVLLILCCATIYLLLIRFHIVAETCPELYVKYHGNWSKIQKLYESDSIRWKKLDKDGDKVACDIYKPTI